MIAGTLQVEMSANIARLSKDMADAKRKVSDTMDSINNTVARTTGILASLGVGVGFAAVAAGFHRIIDAAAKLDDVAEKTGATVEELSKLDQIARIGGHSVDTYETALIRLSKALHAQGDEAKGSGKALAALGLSQDALRGKDTAESLRIVAVELAKYQDGAGKTALAIDLLGKSGAQALPFLKDLATEQGIAARVTTEQAAAAEELQKSLARMRNEMSLAGQQTALKLVPPMLDWINANREAIRIAGSVTSALRLFVFNMEAMTTEKPREQIQRLTMEIERLQGVAAKPFLLRGALDVLAGPQKMEDAKRQVEFLKFLERQQALAGASTLGGDTRGEMQRFGLSGAKLALDYANNADDATKRALALLEKFQGKLHQIQEEIRKTEGVDSPFLAMKSLIATDKDFKTMTDAQKTQLLDAAELLGLKKDLARQDKELAEGLAQVAQESAAWKSKDIADAVALKEKLLDLIDPLRAIKRENEAIDGLVSGGWMTEADARLAKLPSDVRALLQPMKNLHNEIQQAWESGLLTTEQMQAAVLRASDKIETATDSAKEFGHAISTAFEDAVIEGRKLKDVVNALGMTIAKIWFRKTVTAPLENAIGSGGGILASLGKLFGFGGGGGSAGGVIDESGAFGSSLGSGYFGAAHSGGIVGQLHQMRAVNADHFYNAPRFHRGGIAAGEVPVVAKIGEGIFTQEQMRALAPVNDREASVQITQNIQVDSRSDIASVRAAMAAAKNEAVREVANQVRRGGGFRKAVRG